MAQSFDGELNAATEAALTVLQYGSVAPVRSGIKHTYFSGWQEYCPGEPIPMGKDGKPRPHGNNLKTPDAVIAYYLNHRNDGVALITGNTIVIDLDTESKDHPDGRDTLREWEASNGELPCTIKVCTGSGGTHLYFDNPDLLPIDNDQGNGTGIDVRGWGGCVIAPRSKHPNGEYYEWSEDSADVIAPIDNTVIALIEWLKSQHKTEPSEGTATIAANKRTTNKQPANNSPSGGKGRQFGGLRGTVGDGRKRDMVGLCGWAWGAGYEPHEILDMMRKKDAENAYTADKGALGEQFLVDMLDSVTGRYAQGERTAYTAEDYRKAEEKAKLEKYLKFYQGEGLLDGDCADTAPTEELLEPLINPFHVENPFTVINPFSVRGC